MKGDRMATRAELRRAAQMLTEWGDAIVRAHKPGDNDIDARATLEGLEMGALGRVLYAHLRATKGAKS